MFREISFNVITKIISGIASYPSSMSISVVTKEVILIDLSTELSNFDSEILIATVLVNLAMYLSSSVFGNNLLISR